MYTQPKGSRPDHKDRGFSSENVTMENVRALRA
jgi:hypothetical protein